MKVCHVTSVHPRYDIRIYEKECISLAKAGYETCLIVNDSGDDEVINGVHIIPTGFKPRNRKERFLKSSKIVLKKALETDASVYHLHDPELLSIAVKLKRMGKIVIFDAHEGVSEQIKDKSWIPAIFRGIVANIYSLYANNIMKKLDGLITVTPNIVKKLTKINSNTTMVTNYPIVSEEENIPSHKEDKQKYVFFAGGISEQWCHENVIKAVNKFKDIKYYYAGKSFDDTYLKTLLDAGNTGKYLGIIPHTEVINYYAGAIAGMAILNCSQVGNEGTLGNTKLFEVMQAGKPVICSDLRLWREIIEEYECGICVNWMNVDEISNAIKYLISYPDEAARMGINGKRAVNEKYNWKTQELVLIDFYKKILA